MSKACWSTSALADTDRVEQLSVQTAAARASGKFRPHPSRFEFAFDTAVIARAAVLKGEEFPGGYDVAFHASNFDDALHPPDPVPHPFDG
jgi:hypothetical protein